ncbi:MAG: hypothetical protein B2I17_01905 [Thermoplasmatales archaeon B_DKE]|nr:MAG: hypothetical protein B2I17_01905 [Thermoplasmatales archaeon B_DKE]
MSLKVFLLYHGINFPKTQNILTAVVGLISSDDFDDPKMKGNSELIFSTFHTLLDLKMLADTLMSLHTAGSSLSR